MENQARWKVRTTDTQRAVTLPPDDRIVIRLALSGEILYERESVAGEEMRVWELKQHFCIAISSDAYFAWQLCDDYRLLQDHYLVANVAKNLEKQSSPC